MELLSAFDILARHRILSVFGLLAGLAAGLALGGAVPGSSAGRTITSSTANVRVLLDTNHSLVNDLRAQADTIDAQAILLADLLAAPAQTRVIARAAGVAPSAVAVLRPQATSPPKASPLATRDASLSSPARATVSVETSDLLPIVAFEATAPDPAQAARLAGGAVSALRSVAVARASRPALALRVTQLGPVRRGGVTTSGGHETVLAAGAGILVVVLWSVTIVIVDGLARRWREPIDGAQAA